MALNPDRDTTTLTDWFEADVQPAREGVFQRRFPAGPYSCWSGDRWYGDSLSPAAAALEQKPSRHQAVPWRGLVSEPSEPCWACRGHTVIDLGFDAETEADLIDECPEC